MIDILQYLQGIHRETTRHGEGSGELVTLRVRRRYDAAVADVWSAITDRARLSRWMFPISGELRAGGSFQFEGNAGGDILACEPPDHLKVTYGMASSIVDVWLSPLGRDTTDLLLEHTVPIAIAQSGAGSLFVGPGWDLGLVLLALHLGDGGFDAASFHGSRSAQEVGAASTEAWAQTVTASGTATADEIAAGRAMALAQFAPDLPR
jgi:uncharacterized protein YndB with AHSA1/START domain